MLCCCVSEVFWQSLKISPLKVSKLSWISIPLVCLPCAMQHSHMSVYMLGISAQAAQQTHGQSTRHTNTGRMTKRIEYGMHVSRMSCVFPNCADDVFSSKNLVMLSSSTFLQHFI